MSKGPNARTVKPNAETIKRLRGNRGWRVEDLARRAGCSVKTVKNIENGSNVYLFTLSKLAEVFGVEYSSLTDDVVPIQYPINDVMKPRTFEVTIRITTPYDEFDEGNDLLKILSILIKRIGSTDVDPIDPTSVTPGSTEITLKMTAKQINILIYDYADYDRRRAVPPRRSRPRVIDKLNIISLRAPYPISSDRVIKVFDGTKKEWYDYIQLLDMEARAKKRLEEVKKKRNLQENEQKKTPKKKDKP